MNPKTLLQWSSVVSVLLLILGVLSLFVEILNDTINVREIISSLFMIVVAVVMVISILKRYKKLK
jgi:multisubunit Na+/H+ antiporter MnhG subunit